MCLGWKEMWALESRIHVRGRANREWMSWKKKVWSEVAYRARLQVRKERCGGERSGDLSLFPWSTSICDFWKEMQISSGNILGCRCYFSEWCRIKVTHLWVHWEGVVHDLGRYLPGESAHRLWAQGKRFLKPPWHYRPLFPFSNPSKENIPGNFLAIQW